jgi:hypothetical protein
MFVCCGHEGKKFWNSHTTDRARNFNRSIDVDVTVGTNESAQEVLEGGDWLRNVIRIWKPRQRTNHHRRFSAFADIIMLQEAGDFEIFKVEYNCNQQ